MYFVYLNQKQDSRDGIATYRNKAKKDVTIIEEINQITEAMTNCEAFSSNLKSLLNQHETIVSTLIDQKPIKTVLFNDFEGAIKSLGAWGGDFVLVTSKIDPNRLF